MTEETRYVKLDHSRNSLILYLADTLRQEDETFKEREREFSQIGK